LVARRFLLVLEINQYRCGRGARRQLENREPDRARLKGSGEMIRSGEASWHRSAGSFASWSLKAAVLLGALLLASCAGTVAEAPQVPLIAEPFDITEVDVILSKSVNYGVEMIDGSSSKEFAQKVQVALKQKLTAELVQPKTQRKQIRLEVVLDRVDLSSGIGRAVLKSESNIGGFVTLIDKRTKNALARRDLYTGDDSTRFYGGGDGKLGGVFALGALAANAAQSGDDTRIASVVDPFTARVKAWLGRP
jgi:hypothetical protein